MLARSSGRDGAGRAARRAWNDSSGVAVDDEGAEMSGRSGYQHLKDWFQRTWC